MQTVRSILCPVDFSESSRHALSWATAIAQHRGGELTVLSVGEPLLTRAAAIRTGVDLVQAEIRPALRAFVERTVSDRLPPPVPVRLDVTVGDPADAILRTARRRRAGVIVMGTHGRGGFRKLVLGSTTEQVLRRTCWPVLAVPTAAAPALVDAPPGGPARPILLATDFRASATAAVQWAADLAFDLKAPLVLAHVVDPVALPRPWQALAADFEGERVASAQQRLARLAASVRHPDHHAVVSLGRPADAIAALATEHDAGLVVMGLAGPGDVEPRGPGAIAYRVLRSARVPVLVVPARRSTRQWSLPGNVPDRPAARDRAFVTDVAAPIHGGWRR